MKRPVSSESGFSLFFVILVLSLIAAFSTIATRFVFLHATVSRRASSISEMEKVYEAIMGNPHKGNFGYVGDMGVLPSALDDLLTNPSNTTYAARTNGVMMGWNGPYVNIGFEPDDFKKDEWNVPYVYATTQGSNLLTSHGADRKLGTLDDIKFQSKDPFSIAPIQDNDFFKGVLILRIITSQASLPSVKVYYSANGEEAFLSSGTDFQLSTDPCNACIVVSTPISLHHGIHAVEVAQGGKTIFANVSVYAGDITEVTLGTICRPLFCCAVCGLDSVTFEGQPLIDSWDSSQGEYDPDAAGTSGNVCSNGFVSLSNGTVKGGVIAGTDLLGEPNSVVHCDALVGTGVSNMKGTILGTVEFGFDPVPCCTSVDVDAEVAAAKASNNNNQVDPAFLTGTKFRIGGYNTTTLDSGTYYFTEFVVEGRASVFINGKVKIRMDDPGLFVVTGRGASLNPLGPAANLEILSNSSVAPPSGGVEVSGTATILYGVVIAPRTEIKVAGTSEVFGALIGKTVSIEGTGSKPPRVHYDTTLPHTGGLCPCGEAVEVTPPPTPPTGEEKPKKPPKGKKK